MTIWQRLASIFLADFQRFRQHVGGVWTFGWLRDACRPMWMHEDQYAVDIVHTVEDYRAPRARAITL